MQSETKTWKTSATFQTYQEASDYKDSLVGKHELIKIRRGAKEYRVKVWDPPVVKKENKKSKKSFSKGENNKRRQKNDNKKIRARYAQE
jgi:hypothetical protein|tara:strand:+ start:345 stop:611 length:267 start_codon:yes stop_codon:yes gene_type:complete